MKQWYALHTKPRAEKRVRSALQQQNIEAYLPELMRSKAKGTVAPRPFFPRYLFMHLDLNQCETARWRWTPGLLHIVTLGDEPVSVPDRAIALIRQQLERLNAQGTQPDPPFRKGESVRITSGPFAGMLAIFDRVTGPEQRVQVLLDFLGGLNRVHLTADTLEKAPERPKRPRRTRGRGRRINRT